MTRILIIRLGAMGDVLMTTPTLRALKEKFPDAEITYVTGKGLGPVVISHTPTPPAPESATPSASEWVSESCLAEYPFAEPEGSRGVRAGEVIEFDKTAKGFLALAPKLRAARFDLCVNLQPSLKTYLLALVAGAKTTLTYKRDHGFHAVENTLQTLAPLGIDVAKCSRHTEFAIPDEAHARVRALLKGRGISEGEKLVLVTPGATAESRQWPLENLVAFLDLLTETRSMWRVGFFGGGGDRHIAEAALAQVKSPERLVSFLGATNLKESGALLARADALVTMDTGPMHLAAAVGCPIVALFGATSPARTGPAPNVRRPVQPLVLVHNEGLDCVPCMRRTCARGDRACLARLEPQRVLEALEKQLS